MSEEITRMPAVALRGMTILPSMIVHFDVSRDKSIKAIEQAMTADQKLFVVTQRDPEASDPGIDDLYHIGTVVEIKQLVKLPKNIIRVLVEGLERAELLEMEKHLPDIWTPKLQRSRMSKIRIIREKAMKSDSRR